MLKRIKPRYQTKSGATPKSNQCQTQHPFFPSLSLAPKLELNGSVLHSIAQHDVAYVTEQCERNMLRHRHDTIAEGIGLDRRGNKICTKSYSIMI